MISEFYSIEKIIFAEKNYILTFVRAFRSGVHCQFNCSYCISEDNL